MYVVKSGVVSLADAPLKKSPNPLARAKTRRLERGRACGDAALVGGAVVDATATAAEVCSCYALSSDVLADPAYLKIHDDSDAEDAAAVVDTIPGELLAARRERRSTAAPRRFAATSLEDFEVHWPSGPGPTTAFETTTPPTAANMIEHGRRPSVLLRPSRRRRRRQQCPTLQK